MPGLSQLTLKLDRTNITDDGLDALGRGLPSKLSVLTLYLDRTNITDGGLEALGRGLPSELAVLTLKLDRTNITDGGLEALGRGLPSKLSELRLFLTKTNITDGGLEALGRGLPSEFAVLTLSLSRTNITDDGLEALGRDLPSKLSQLTLYLDRTNITDGGLEALERALPSKLSRLTLTFSGTNITDGCLEALGRALPSKLSRLTLGLTRTNITDDGLEALGRDLPSKLSQLTLYLQETNITDDGFEALGQGLPSKLSWLYLSFTNTNITDGGLEALRRALPSKLSELTLYLGGTNITEKGSAALLRGMPESVEQFSGSGFPSAGAFDVQGGSVKAQFLFDAISRRMATRRLFSALFSDSGEDILMRNDAQRTLYMMAQAQHPEIASQAKHLQDVSGYLLGCGGAPSFWMLLWHSRHNWRTYVCVGGALLLGVAMAAIQSATASRSSRYSLLPEGEQAGTRRKGATLLAAVAVAKQESRLGKLGPPLCKALRASEVCAHWILFTVPVMYTVHPIGAAAFAAIVYGLPAICAHGVGSVIRRPVLIVASASTGQVLWALVRLLLTCALTWQVYCAAFPQLNWDLQAWGGSRYELVSSSRPVLPWPTPGTGRASKYVGRSADSPPFLARFFNPKAHSFLVSQGWFLDGLFGVQVELGTAFAMFVYAIASVAAVWVLCLARWRSSYAPASSASALRPALRPRRPCRPPVRCPCPPRSPVRR